MKIIITILAAMAVIDAVIAYACCVVAGRADETAEEIWEDGKEEKRENESTDQSSGRDYR